MEQRANVWRERVVVSRHHFRNEAHTLCRPRPRRPGPGTPPPATGLSPNTVFAPGAHPIKPARPTEWDFSKGRCCDRIPHLDHPRQTRAHDSRTSAMMPRSRCGAHSSVTPTTRPVTTDEKPVNAPALIFTTWAQTTAVFLGGLSRPPRCELRSPCQFPAQGLATMLGAG